LGEKVAVGDIDLAKRSLKNAMYLGIQAKNRRRRTEKRPIARKTKKCPIQKSPPAAAFLAQNGLYSAVFSVVKGLWALLLKRKQILAKSNRRALYKNDVLHQMGSLGVGDTIRTAKK
jgi:hypothetical protein